MGTTRQPIHLIVGLLVLLGALLPRVGPAQAQDPANSITQTIVGQNSQRLWKLNKTGEEQGTVWYQPGFDDSSWTDAPVKFYERHGTVAANGAHAYYFREEFEITDVHQITELQLGLYYDDAAVMYLNGQEVYRTIRNNLPSTDEIPVGDLIPVDTQVVYGGAENYYVQIPAETNKCERGCTDGGKTYPIDVGLLEEGTNVFGVMAWTRVGSDLGFDLAIDVVRDLDAPLPQSVVLNEVVASNTESHLDEDGDSPDWFELVNMSAEDVSLDGWVVEDAAGAWQFPAVTIAAGDYLTVFASDKNRAPTDGSPLHTNFKLSKEGDSLRLVDPDSIVRDEWDPLPRQMVDVAWGRASDGENIGYLASATPGAANSALSTALDPVLRPFSNRLLNRGDEVSFQIDAFDPEGTALTYSMPNGLSLGVDSTTGAITGTASKVGVFKPVITVTDQAGQTAQQRVWFTVVGDPTPTPGMVLNEYNAVAPDRELLGGSDSAFTEPIGNGGDWYEFVVVDDLLDIRGWTIELWDRDRQDDLGDDAASLTFADDFFLAALKAGTIITISEDRPDDLSYDPSGGDWTINLQANDLEAGAMFAVQQNFNSTRSSQHVKVRDADGVLRSGAVGETEAWDNANGGVSGGEVMNLCIDPVASAQPDPVDDYRDNSTTSTYGEPNQCEYTEVDPNDPANLLTRTFDQDFAALRATAGRLGDANCDGKINIVDSLVISQLEVATRADAGGCPHNLVTEANGHWGDFNVDGTTNIVDALLISQCSVGVVVDPYCP